MAACVRSGSKDFGVSQKFYTERFLMCVKELNLNSGSGAGCVRVCVMTQGRKSVFQPRCLKRCSEDSAAFVSLAFLCE